MQRAYFLLKPESESVHICWGFLSRLLSNQIVFLLKLFQLFNLSVVSLLQKLSLTRKIFDRLIHALNFVFCFFELVSEL